jgi:putative sporulation protein YtaF
MHFFYIIFISIVNNLDNISVRIAYSLRGIKISILKNLWISLITFIIASCAAFFGSTISDVFDERLSSYISMLLLISIGLWIIITSYLKKDKESEENVNIKSSKNLFTILDNPQCADLDYSKEIDFKEATFLGLALSLDNLGGGLSAGMIGLNFIYIGFISAVISFLTLLAGNYLSKLFRKFNFGSRATIFAGVVLILIGIVQVL